MASNSNSNGNMLAPVAGAPSGAPEGEATPLDAVVVPFPPTPGAPSAPKGFDRSRPGRGGKVRLQLSQLECAPMVAQELTSATSAGEDFGPHIPKLAAIGAGMTLASQWSSERIKADAWSLYATVQERLAWAPVTDGLASLRPAFEHALNHDPSIAERYPSLALFFGIGSRSAAKGARTRRARKSAKEVKAT